jgi:ComEC/Rec2-related protein
MQPAAMRAGLMAIAVLFAKTAQRKTNLLNIISLAVAILIIIKPGLIYSAGFQMSVASMFGIAVLYNPIRNLFGAFANIDNPVLNFILSSFALSISASLAVSPIVAYYFGVYSLVSPLTNLFVVPLTSLGLIFTMGALISAFISIDIAYLYANSADFLFNLSQKINDLGIELPYAYIQSADAVYITLGVSLIFIYLLFSASWQRFAFRSAVCIAAVFCIIKIIPADESEYQTKIFPRSQFVAAFIPINENKTFAYIADRKPEQYPYRDISLENYILQSNDTLIIGYTGNAGINLMDALKKNAVFKSYEIPLNQQIALNKALKTKIMAPQIIEYDIHDME